MNPWKIQCWCGRSWISKIIQFRTWSHFSHVSITDDDWLWEATTPYVRKVRPIYAYSGQKGVAVAELCFRDALTEEQERRMVEFLDKQVGQKYDYGDLIRFLLRDDQQNPDQEWICSEYVAAACIVAGRTLQARIAPYKVPPEGVFTSPTLYLLRFGIYDHENNYRFEDGDIEKAFKEPIYSPR